MTGEKKIKEYRAQLGRLRDAYKATSPTDPKNRKAIRKEIGHVYEMLRDLGIGYDLVKQNTPPEHRDFMSIWHIRNIKVGFPPGTLVRHALENMSNGHCGD